MFGEFEYYVAVCVTGFVTTYIVTPIVRNIALSLGIVDLPDERRPHKRPTARGGGLAVVIGVHVACLIALAFPLPKVTGGLDFGWWQQFAGASAVIVVGGAVDDFRGLNPWLKLSGQVLAALLMLAGGARFGQLLGHDLPPPLDCALVVLWLVTAVNAFNLIDGLDGLASGLAVISAIGLCCILVAQQNLANTVILFGFIGACSGFLRYNTHPASIFLGDTGSMFIGFTLGTLALQTFSGGTSLFSIFIPVVVLGIPLYDAFLAVWRRSVRLWIGDSRGGLRRGIMKPDMEHLHHRLLQAGFTTRGVATLLCAFNTFLVLIGLLLTLFQSRAAGIMLLAVLLAVYVLIRHLAVIELRETGQALLTGLTRKHCHLNVLGYVLWDLLWLTCSAVFITQQSEEHSVVSWHISLLDLLIWVIPTFSLIALSRAYNTCWARARLRDLIVVAFSLQAGLVLSIGLNLLIDPIPGARCLTRALLTACICHPAIVGPRLLYHCIDELLLWSRQRTEQTDDIDRVLLYGAGIRAELFLKTQAVQNAKMNDKRRILGILDEATVLHFHWVYGQLVLGGFKDLQSIITRHQINRIIITTDLRAETRAALEAFCTGKKIRLTEWRQVECTCEKLSSVSDGTYD